MAPRENGETSSGAGVLVVSLIPPKRKRIWIGALLALALPLLAGSQDAGMAEPKGVWSWEPRRLPLIPDTSIVAILADPDAFDGREIKMVGYVSLDPGQRAIWFAPSDYENSVLANSIGIEELVSQSLQKNDYAEVRGIFHAARSPNDPRAGTITPRFLRPWVYAKSARPPPQPKRRCSLWF